jgi:RNA polymerase sigma factor (sigma-70 family)
MLQSNDSINEQLVNESQSYSEDFFKSIFEKHNTSLIYFANRMLSSSKQEAEDIVLEAYVELYKNLNNFRTSNEIKAFLYMNVKKRCLSTIKKRSQKQQVEVDFYLQTDNSLIETEVISQIWKTIEEFPTACRKVFILSYLESLSTREISNRLQITESTVRSHKNNAIKLLRKKLTGLNEFDQPEKTESNKFCIRVRDGRIQLIYEQGDNIWQASDNNLTLINGLYVFTKSKWSIILSELEKLINKWNLKEQELQDFFETYPELIIDEQYSSAIPQATIVKDDTTTWKADFILIPSDQLSFSKILELKLPNEKISLSSHSGHSDFTKKLFKSINQIKDYYSAFDSERTKSRFKEIYKTEIFKPDLQLVFGRRNSIVDKRHFLELQRRNNLKIIDWDTLYEQLKRRYK